MSKISERDKVINKLILTIGNEIDYWMLESNRVIRENEYGTVTYKKMFNHFTNVRSKLLEILLLLPGLNKEEIDNQIKT